VTHSNGKVGLVILEVVFFCNGGELHVAKSAICLSHDDIMWTVMELSFLLLHRLQWLISSVIVLLRLLVCGYHLHTYSNCYFFLIASESFQYEGAVMLVNGLRIYIRRDIGIVFEWYMGHCAPLHFQLLLLTLSALNLDMMEVLAAEV